MSLNPYLSLEDFQQLKDASTMYKDYLISSGVRKEAPELYNKYHYTHLRLLDFVQFWQQYPGLGDEIQLKRPSREL